jgi:hypothetical protein
VLVIFLGFRFGVFWLTKILYELVDSGAFLWFWWLLSFVFI